MLLVILILASSCKRYSEGRPCLSDEEQINLCMGRQYARHCFNEKIKDCKEIKERRE